MTWVMLVQRRGTEFPWIAKTAAKFIDQIGTTELHSDATTNQDRGVGVWDCTSPSRGKPDCARETTSGESQSNGIIERTVGLVGGQATKLKTALEHRIGWRQGPA